MKIILLPIGKEAAVAETDTFRRAEGFTMDPEMAMAMASRMNSKRSESGTKNGGSSRRRRRKSRGGEGYGNGPDKERHSRKQKSAPEGITGSDQPRKNMQKRRRTRKSSRSSAGSKMPPKMDSQTLSHPCLYLQHDDLQLNVGRALIQMGLHSASREIRTSSRKHKNLPTHCQVHIN